MIRDYFKLLLSLSKLSTFCFSFFSFWTMKFFDDIGFRLLPTYSKYMKEKAS